MYRNEKKKKKKSKKKVVLEVSRREEEREWWVKSSGYDGWGGGRVDSQLIEDLSVRSGLFPGSNDPLGDWGCLGGLLQILYKVNLIF